MKLSLKPNHLKRYKDIALLLFKYGRSDLAKEFDVDGLFEEKERLVSSEASAAKPEELAADLEKMGPTFVKLGQLLSGRADLLSEPYLKALARLQDNVKPFSFAEVEKIVSDELGVRISKAFSFFSEHSLAAASLGQVHAAALRDGRPVVVKVQRPEIRKQIAEDFEVLEQIAAFLDEHTEIGRRYQLVKILAEFKATLILELDYQREAANLSMLANNLREFPGLQIPQPVADYSSHRVLTMEYINGTKITALSPLARLELDGDRLAEELFQAYLKQVLVDGFFHADPHPGNIFLTDDGRVALLDLGMVGRVTPAMQENLLRLLLAVSEGNSDEVTRITLRVSQIRNDFDEQSFCKTVGLLVSEQKNKTLEQQDVGEDLLKLARAAVDAGLFVPSDLTILGKTLLQLDQVGKILSPHFNPNASIRRNVSKITTDRMLRNASPGRLFGSFLEMKDFVGGLPHRINRVLDTVAKSDFEINVKTPDAHHLLNGFEKIANRITTGLILAALIIGASLLMQVNNENARFQIMGYPGLAMLCFLAGVGGSAWLVLTILIKDYKDKRKRRE